MVESNWSRSGTRTTRASLEPLQNIDSCLGELHVEIGLGTRELFLLNLQFTRVFASCHHLRVAQSVLCTEYSGRGDRQVFLQRCQSRNKTTFQILRNSDRCSRHISFGASNCGIGQVRIFRAFTDFLIDQQRLQPEQLISRPHLCPTLDYRDNDVVTSDTAFNFRVVGTLQRSLFSDGDKQFTACDRVSLHGLESTRRSDFRQDCRSGNSRQTENSNDCDGTFHGCSSGRLTGNGVHDTTCIPTICRSTQWSPMSTRLHSSATLLHRSSPAHLPQLP